MALISGTREVLLHVCLDGLPWGQCRVEGLLGVPAFEQRLHRPRELAAIVLVAHLRSVVDRARSRKSVPDTASSESADYFCGLPIARCDWIFVAGTAEPCLRGGNSKLVHLATAWRARASPPERGATVKKTKKGDVPGGIFRLGRCPAWLLATCQQGCRLRSLPRLPLSGRKRRKKSM